MNKIQYFILLLSVIFITSSCKKVVEKDKEVIRVADTQSSIVKPAQKFLVLDNKNITSLVSKDTVLYENQKVPIFEITVSGSSADSIHTGTIIVDQSGRGAVYLVTGIQKNKSLNINLSFFAIKAPLSFLFNYEGATISYNSPENRAKRNSTIDAKIYGNDLVLDGSRSTLDETGKSENWQGYTSSVDNTLINLNFSAAQSIGLMEVNDKGAPLGNSKSVDIKLSGYLKINPGIDFLMTYNPEYIKSDQSALIAFISAMTGSLPSVLFGPALAVGTLKRIKAITYTEFDYGLDVELAMKGTIEKKLFEKDLLKVEDIYMVGFCPVSQVTKLKLKVDLSAAAADVVSFSYKNENDIVLGFDLQRTSLTDKTIKWYNNVDSRNTYGLSNRVEFELKAGIKLVCETEIYVLGIVGPHSEAGLFFDGTYKQWVSTYSPYPGWALTVDAGVIFSGSIDLSFFHYDHMTWEMFKSVEVIPIMKNLYTCPYKIELIDGNNQTGSKGQYLPKPIKVKVEDSFGNLVPSFLPQVAVFFGAKDNTGFNGSVSDSPVLSTDEVAQTNWSLANQPGGQNMYAFLKSETGTPTGIAALVTAFSNSVVPTVTTSPITNLTQTTAGCGGNVTFDDGLSVTARGVCWSTSTIPTIYDNKTINGSGLGSFTSSIANLIPGVNYYVRAYATNSAGTGYGDAISLNGLTADINNIVPQYIIDEMKNLGMPVYTGYTPPIINGIYNTTPCILYSTNVYNDSYSPGHQFADLRFQFYNQDNSKMTLETNYINGTESGSGYGSFIAGSGNNFSVFAQVNSISQGYPVVIIQVYSGTVGDAGITNMFYSVFMVENYGMDSMFIPNGSGRVIYDQDGFSERVSYLKSATINNKLDGGYSVKHR